MWLNELLLRQGHYSNVMQVPYLKRLKLMYCIFDGDDVNTFFRIFEFSIVLVVGCAK